MKDHHLLIASPPLKVIMEILLYPKVAVVFAQLAKLVETLALTEITHATKEEDVLVTDKISQLRAKNSGANIKNEPTKSIIDIKPEL